MRNYKWDPIIRLKKEHPWLKKPVNALYSNIEYYEKLISQNKVVQNSDEDYLDCYLEENYQNMGKVLELGCGTGRMTKILHKYAREIIAADKNSQMLDAAKKKFLGTSNVHFVLSEMDNYINNAIKTNEISKFNSITSFWGINYMLHYDFLRINPNGKLINAKSPKEIKKAEVLATRKFKRLLEYSKSGTRLIFFHVRSDTEEQYITRKHLGKVNLLFTSNRKTPSHKIIEKTLSEMQKEKRLEYSIKYIDSTVKFENLEMALEIFFNFHLKGYFNKRPECISIFNEIQNDLSGHMLHNGKVKLGTGFILFDILRK